MALENGKVGKNILGDVHWEGLGNGRVRCVETGHEMIESAKDGYVYTKKCRLALFEGALRNRKPPLHMFEESPDARDKIVCKLTGAVMNKQEDAVWKHMLGKKFQRKLEEKEAEKKKKTMSDASCSNRTLAVQGAQKLEEFKSKCNGGPPKKKLKSNSALSDSTLNASVDGDENNGEDAVTTNGGRQKKKKKVRIADATSMETALVNDIAQDEDTTKSERSMLKKQQGTLNALGDCHMDAAVSGDVVMEEDAATSSEEDFWIPPVGHRWDLDMGGNNRWSRKNQDLSALRNQADDMEYSEEEEA